MNIELEFLNVRFEKITIRNCKNIEYGTVDFVKTSDNDFSFEPSVLGVYGQNGSGKTALIQVVEIIKTLLMGNSLPNKVVDWISVDSDNCEILVDFVLTNNTTKKYKVKYSVELKKVSQVLENTILSFNDQKKKYKVVVNRETLSASFVDLENIDSKVGMSTIIDCDHELNNIFSPNTKLLSLTNESKEAQNELLVSKKTSRDSSKSFVFCYETLMAFRNNSKDSFSMNVIENLVNFANSNLFVIRTENSGLINLNVALPFNFKIEDSKHTSIGNIAIDLTSTSTIPVEAYDIVNQSIKSMNTVLTQLIPNLSVDLAKVGSQNDENGHEHVQVQLYSIRKNKKVSMVNESEGIKKLVSILQLLIVMYNNPSTTVAIDEIDSGVFEYLLGELLRIISKQSKGQLIFTSHNLRALETIDKKFVYFTTTNEKNRYVKMAYVSKNNNLRDFYFHEILLGGQKEELYEQTNNGAIAFAFKEAGEFVE